jgi:hypothetical protein
MEIKDRLQQMNIRKIHKICQKINIESTLSKKKSIEMLLKPLQNKYKMNRTRGRVGAKKMGEFSKEDIKQQVDIDLLERLKMLSVTNENDKKLISEEKNKLNE